MKVQEIMRGSVVVMGLGIALFFASPVRAQQDVSPDTFDINPGTPTEVAVAVQVPVPVAVQDNGVAQAAIMPASNWDGTFAAPLNDVTMVVILAVGTGLVALYTVAATRRQRRRASPVSNSAYVASYGATTH
jgi:precorrin-2 methylase